MKISYFPGCSLKATAQNLEISAINSAKTLGIEFDEIPNWTCCGTVYSLPKDDLVHQLASLRNLLRVKQQGYKMVVTLCSMCFNTLKRANDLARKDLEKRQIVDDYMYEEKDKYHGDVEILHFLEILRDNIGFDKIKPMIKKSLKGLKLSPYYGCLLVRPKEVSIDKDWESPSIMENFLTSLGADIVDSPFKLECCGSYQTVNQKDIVIEKSKAIIDSARTRGAEALVLSCPLCDFNLDDRQKDIKAKYRDFKSMPVFYFTQLLAIALGLSYEEAGLNLNYNDPKPLLKSKGLL